MFEVIVRSTVYSICFMLSISLVLYLELLINQGNEWSDTEGWYIISPFLLISILYGFLTSRFRDIVLYSFIGAVLMTSVFYIENFFNPTEQPIEPDIFDLAFISPIPYGLAILGLSFIATASPLFLGWILGITKRKIQS